MQQILRGIAVVFILTAFIGSYAFAKGESAGKGTGNIVSQAAHKAQSKGLKGKELAEEVHEAIETRKEGKEEEIEEKKESAKREKAQAERGEGHKLGKGMRRGHHKGR